MHRNDATLAPAVRDDAGLVPSIANAPQREPNRPRRDTAVAPVGRSVARGAPRLLASLREAIQLRHYSPRTGTAYRHWVIRFVRFHGSVK